MKDLFTLVTTWHDVLAYSLAILLSISSMRIGTLSPFTVVSSSLKSTLHKLSTQVNDEVILTLALGL